ncbi:MAG: lactate racemase domain-containing protein [Planctomycetota bacterium]|nr:lactate racemase domain-containing protein [Planctomycetota bacterium]
MQFPDSIDYKLGGDDFDLPRVFKARQLFARDRIEDIEAEVAGQMDKLSLPALEGKRVALTAGSRGVADQARILKAVADRLKGRGARPFIVPGMGSHAGATAEGQREFIAGYGITEESMGVPILSCMDTVRLGTTPSGVPVYCDRNAAEADYILPVHRVKPHTDFKGEVESGPSKMLVIGLGKHLGATYIHNLGFSAFARLIPEAARVFFATGKILAGVAVVENAYDQTMIIEAIPTPDILEREKILLAKSKEVMAKFHLDSIDVLVIEEIGKDVSGAGMDSNIVGNPASGEPGFDVIPIRRIAVLGISELSHGNGIGLGMAHLVTVDFMKQLDIAATYINSITSRVIEGARIPLVANSDLDAIKIGVFCGMGVEPARAKIVQITNTLALGDLVLSEPYLPLIRDDRRFEVLSEPEPMRFDAGGRLARLPRQAH